MYKGNKAQWRSLVIAVALLLPLFFSLTFSFEAGGEEHSNQENWLFVIYMAADNDLEDAAEEDLADMRAALLPSYITISLLLQNKESTRALTLTADGEKENSLEEIDNTWDAGINLADPKVLTEFIFWSVNATSSERIFLVMWGHGSGWKGTAEGGGQYMTLVDMSQAVGQARDRLEGRSLDIIGFDQCNMAMASVAFELREHADYFIFSEKEEDARGWPYQRFLNLMPERSPSPIGMGGLLIDEFISWSEAYSGYSATLSMVCSSRLENLSVSVSVFVEAAVPALPLFSTEAYTAVFGAQRYDATPLPVDLFDIFSRLSTELPSPMLRQLSHEAGQSVLEAVVVNGVYDNPWDHVRADRAHGLGVYAPEGEMEQSYRNMQWASATGWDVFIDAVKADSPAAEEAHIVVKRTHEKIFSSVEGDVEGEPFFVLTGPGGSIEYGYPEGKASNFSSPSTPGTWHVEVFFLRDNKWVAHDFQPFRIHGDAVLLDAKYVWGNHTIMISARSWQLVPVDVVISLGNASSPAEYHNITLYPGTGNYWVSAQELDYGEIYVCIPGSVPLEGEEDQEDADFFDYIIVRVPVRIHSAHDVVMRGRIRIGGEPFHGEVVLWSVNSEGERSRLANTTARKGVYALFFMLDSDSGVLVMEAGGTEREVEYSGGGAIVANMEVSSQKSSSPTFSILLLLLAGVLLFLAFCAWRFYRGMPFRET